MNMVEIVGFGFIGMCIILSACMTIGVGCYLWETIHTYRKEKNNSEIE